MRKLFLLGFLFLILLTGCGQDNTSVETTQIKAEDGPTVMDIALPPLEQKLHSQENSKNFFLEANVTWDNEITFLYEYQEDGKLQFQLARLQPDNTWEINTPEWADALLKETGKKPLSALNVCSDGSYYGMIVPEDENSTPSFYHILLDGTIIKESLPDGILEETKDSPEQVEGMTLTEKDEIILTTYTMSSDNQEESADEVGGYEPSHLIVYNPYTKKLVSKRDYIGRAEDLFTVGDYVFTMSRNEIYVYLLKGGDVQSTYSNKELTEFQQKKSSQIPSAGGLCSYSGGKYAYWYTEAGIYRIDTSLTENAENTVEKVIDPKNYHSSASEGSFGVTEIIGDEDGKETTIYVKGIPYNLQENKEEKSYKIDSSDPVFIKYISQE